MISLFGTLTEVPTSQVKAAVSVANFNVQITINMPPTFDKYSFAVMNDMYAYHTWSVTAKYENDLESDLPYMDAKIVTSISGTKTLSAPNDWTPIATPYSFFIVNSAVTFELFYSFKRPPQPLLGAETEIYYIRLSMWDQFNIGTETKIIVQMTVHKNYPPYSLLSPADYVIPQIKLTDSFDFPISYKSFKDTEGDEIVFDCTSLYNIDASPKLDASSWVKVTDLK